MTQWVSFKEIKEQVSIEMVLEHYGMLDKLKRKKDELKGLCPFHREKKGSFYANATKNIFQCFGCKAKGNVLDFVARMEKVEIREAGLLLQGWFQTVLEKRSETASDAPVRAEQPHVGIIQPESSKNTPLSFELNVDPSHPYIEERGLDAETIAHFGLGYCRRGLMKGRIAIPIHNELGELVSYSGRWPGEPPEGTEKYLLPPGFHKSQVVYNLHRVAELANQGKCLILVEGFFSVFRLWQSGVQNVVSLMGTSLSEMQRDVLISVLSPDGKLFLLFDDDDAGAQCRMHCLDKLSEFMFVKSLTLPSGMSQPDELSEKEIGEILSR